MQLQTETDERLAPVAGPSPVLKLLYCTGSGLSRRQWPVISKELRIGRRVDPDTGMSLPTDRKASAQHARVYRDGSDIWVRDEGSKNGTWVNGQKIQERTILADGDIVRIGDSLLMLRYELPIRCDAPPDQLAVHQRIRGTSSSICRARHLLWRAAQSYDAVLLLGETGTGKELAAQALHEMSHRRGALVTFNCANLNSTLAESQLFGHAKGSFTGAQAEHQGLFREADGRTLFLDEVGELPLDLQPKLLRALATRVIRPIGANKDEPCDVRILSATNRDLAHAMRTGGFRADLYARLAILTVQMPPLRERREDILPLFLQALGDRPLSARLCEAMLIYRWPLNVRELLKLAAHARVFMDTDDSELDLPAFADLLSLQAEKEEARHAAPALSPGPSTPALELRRARYTREQVERLMQEGQGVLAHVAQRMGRSRRQLRRMLEKFGIDPQPFKPGGA